MKAIINKTHIEGVLYEHSLEMKTTGPNSKAPGTQYIRGAIKIATDDDMTNIIPVYFSYSTAKTAQNKDNATFGVLKNIMDGVIGTYMKDGKEKAAKVRVDSALGLNDFYPRGSKELVSTRRNEGGFVHTCDTLSSDENTRNTFECDMLITNVIRVEADEERELPEKVVVKGAIFDFRKALMPYEFVATNPNAMNYFEDLGASQSNPVFTKIWGRQVSQVVVKKTIEESAFGEASVRETRTTRSELLITGAAKEPYIWDDETTITATELAEAISNREIHLAEAKQRSMEAATATPTPAATTAPAHADFNF